MVNVSVTRKRNYLNNYKYSDIMFLDTKQIYKNLFKNFFGTSIIHIHINTYTEHSDCDFQHKIINFMPCKCSDS